MQDPSVTLPDHRGQGMFRGEVGTKKVDIKNILDIPGLGFVALDIGFSSNARTVDQYVNASIMLDNLSQSVLHLFFIGNVEDEVLGFIRHLAIYLMQFFYLEVD